MVRAGQMGAGIAEVCARAGCEVAVREVGDEWLAAGRQRIERSQDRAKEKGRLDNAGEVAQRRSAAAAVSTIRS